MTAIFLAFVTLILSSVAATAQSLVLRSGEHEGFTRIVMTLPEETQWQITSDDGVLRLRFSTLFTQIDVSSAFTRISRERISEIKVGQDNQSLDFLLSCNCGFRAILEKNSLFVIDIGEGLPLPTRDQGNANQDYIPKIETPADSNLNLPLFFNHASSIFLLPPRLISDNPTVKQSKSNIPQNENELFGTRIISQFIEGAEILNLKSLHAQLSSATSQGLLKTNNQYQLFQLESDSAPLADEPYPNIRTVFGTEFDENAVTLDSQLLDECPTEVDLNIENWGNEAGFVVGLSTWRRSIMQEFDEVSAVAAIGLARHYLYYGFGQEAQVALNLLPSSVPQVDEVEHLRSMARIMDFGYDSQIKDTSWNTECGAEMALWSVLAAENLSSPLELDVSALRLEFERLPQHLRQHLGPQLARKFTQLGDNSTAEGILNSSSRSQINPNPAAQFLQAEKNLNSNDAASINIRFLDVLKSNSEFSPLAVVALVDATVAANQSIDKSLVDLVAAYHFEHRQTELSAELMRAQILSLAFSGRFSESFKMLEQLENDSSSVAYSETRLRIMRRLLEDADDIEFLKGVLGYPVLGLTTALENEFAKRLLEMGFVEHALEILAENASGQDGQTRRTLRAEAALSLRKPIVSLKEATSTPDEFANVSGTMIDHLQYDYSEALLENSDGNTEKVVQDFAFLNLGGSSNDILDDAQNDQGVSKPDSDPANDQVSRSEASSRGVLGQAVRLIEDSGAARAAVQDLLSRMSVDPEPVQ